MIRCVIQSFHELDSVLCLQLRSKLESSKGDTFSGTLITDFLYGAQNGSEILASMDEINYYAALRKWTSSQWTSLLSQ